MLIKIKDFVCRGKTADDLTLIAVCKYIDKHYNSNHTGFITLDYDDTLPTQYFRRGITHKINEKHLTQVDRGLTGLLDFPNGEE